MIKVKQSIALTGTLPELGVYDKSALVELDYQNQSGKAWRLLNIDADFEYTTVNAQNVALHSWVGLRNAGEDTTMDVSMADSDVLAGKVLTRFTNQSGLVGTRPVDSDQIISLHEEIYGVDGFQVALYVKNRSSAISVMSMNVDVILTLEEVKLTSTIQGALLAQH